MKLKDYVQPLHAVGLFGGISPDDLAMLLGCLGAEAREYQKGEFPLMAGDIPEHVGVVLSGRLSIVREDADGNRTLIADLGPSDIFAEALCCAGVGESPVSVMAESDSTVLLLKFTRILHTCPSSCGFHEKLIANMLSLIARKNLFLQGRMEVIGLKSVRAKVLRYLKTFAAEKGQRFSIPLSREEMADYLCVERSALSHELMKMKREGLLEYRKNTFKLL